MGSETAHLSIPGIIPADEYGDGGDGPMEAALKYAASGWYVGPVKRGSKNPGSVLGKGWPSRTTRDPKMIAVMWAGTDHGVFLHAGASGAVIVDVDHPELVPDVLADVLGQGPWQSTRLDSGQRGHYLYRAPAGRRIGNSLGGLGKGWGEVRGINGVIIVEPSVHAEADDGGLYRWEAVGDVPELPAAIAALLPDADRAREIVSDVEVRDFLEAHRAGNAPPWALGAILRKFGAEAFGGRHDAGVRAACWLTREVAAGRFAARDALTQLRSSFVRTFSERERAAGRGEAEYDRIVAYAVGQLTSERVRQVQERHDTSAYDMAPLEPPGPSEGPGVPDGVTGPGDVVSPAGGAHADAQDDPGIPEWLWEERESLRRVRDMALHRVLSPDAVLGAALARISSFVRPGVRVDTGLGRASLNIFSVIVGDSSAGKSEAMSAARELLPAPPMHGWPDRDGLPIGSGEGMAEIYYGIVEEEMGDEYLSGPKKGEPKTKSVRKKVYDHALFFADEGESITRMMERSGTTIAQSIRSAWKADTLGQANATLETKRIVPEGTYAMGLVLAFQPATVGGLFADAAGGTPQRFLFVSAHSDMVSQRRMPRPAPLSNIVHVLPNGDLVLPPSAQEEVWAARVASRARDAPPSGLDGHRWLHRAKLAGVLAILDMRQEITDEDWTLSGVIWEATRRVRDGLVEAIAAERRARTAAEDERRVRVHVDSTVSAHKAVVEADVGRLARWVVRTVKGGVTRISGKDGLRLKCASRDRGDLDDAIATAVEAGRVVLDPDGDGLSLP